MTRAIITKRTISMPIFFAILVLAVCSISNIEKKLISVIFSVFLVFVNLLQQRHLQSLKQNLFAVRPGE